MTDTAAPPALALIAAGDPHTCTEYTDDVVGRRVTRQTYTVTGAPTLVEFDGATHRLDAVRVNVADSTDVHGVFVKQRKAGGDYVNGWGFWTRIESFPTLVAPVAAALAPAATEPAEVAENAPLPIGTRVRVQLDDNRGVPTNATVTEIPRYESGRPRYTLDPTREVQVVTDRGVGFIVKRSRVEVIAGGDATTRAAAAAESIRTGTEATRSVPTRRAAAAAESIRTGTAASFPTVVDVLGDGSTVVRPLDDAEPAGAARRPLDGRRGRA